MKITTLPLATAGHQTRATLTAYLQTPTPKSPVQAFEPLLIVPGGSMTHIPEEETEKTALAFAARGFQVFVLRYSFLSEQAPLYPAPLIDLALAIGTIKQHLSDWQLVDRLHLLCFSAGGQIGALYNDYWDSEWLEDASGLPKERRDFADLVLGYPVIDFSAGFPTTAATRAKWTDDPEKYSASQHVTASNRPTFIWATVDDPVVPAQNSLNYFLAQQKENIFQEIHLFEHGPHGMDIANQLVAHHEDGNQPHVAHWVEMATEWMHGDHRQFKD